jgi:ATP synthase F1 delta subunit
MKLHDRLLAQKYAQAYMNIFGNKFTSDKENKLMAFVAAYKQNPAKFFYLGLHSLAPAVKTNLIGQEMQKFGLTQPLQPLIALLAQQGRLGLLVDVFQALVVLYKKMHGIIDVTVKSAQPLDESSLDVIRKFLMERTGKQVHMIPCIDPSLIAGVRLQGDDFVWEYSIAKQLQTFAVQVQNVMGYQGSIR